MIIEIDPESGFCFGVVNAIKRAEIELTKDENLFCLGDIVHNDMEINRLNRNGLVSINHDQLKGLKNAKVLFRAHGEPPLSYDIVKQNNIQLIDATCPVVLKLQKKIRKAYLETKDNGGQIVIYGKIGHAEVNGLVGQTEGNAIVIEKPEDLFKIDFSRPVILFSQTTKTLQGFLEITESINSQIHNSAAFISHDTICRQVSNKIPKLKEFANKYDVIVFVSGEKSSNGKVLSEVCKSQNPNTFVISKAMEINPEWFRNVLSVGICGATSTPKWLMNEIAEKIKEHS